MPDKDIKKKEQADKDKFEAEKLEEGIIVYTVELGTNKFSTADKKKAFEIWQLLVENFFQLQELGNSYEEPHFRYRAPTSVKLTAETVNVWKDFESAQRAHSAYQAMSKQDKEDEQKAKSIPF